MKLPRDRSAASVLYFLRCSRCLLIEPISEIAKVEPLGSSSPVGAGTSLDQSWIRARIRYPAFVALAFHTSARNFCLDVSKLARRSAANIDLSEVAVIA
jgi:hypothetical protein